MLIVGQEREIHFDGSNEERLMVVLGQRCGQVSRV